MTRAAAAIAAYQLPSRAHVPERLDDDEFHRLLATCERERVLGLLAAMVRDGVLALDDDQQRELESCFRAWLTHALRLEHVLLETTAALDRARIPSRVLKGVALAHTAYDDPADRVFADVDVLVPAGELTRAAQVVAQVCGGHRVQPELRPGFDDAFGKEAMVKVGALEVDLHRTFVEGAYGLTVVFDDLFAPPYRFPLGVGELAALPMPQRMLHACYAAALGDWPPRLVSLRDLAQIVLREQPNLIDVLVMARAWRCEPVVAKAVTLAWDELELTEETPIVQWARRFTPTRAQRRMLAWHVGPARTVTWHAAALLVLPGYRKRFAYLLAIVFPQRTYLRARDLSATRYLRLAWDRITR